MNSIDFLQFNQLSLIVFVISALFLLLEKEWVSLTIVLIGSIFHGSVPAVLVAGLVFWYRLYFSTKRWIIFKDTLSLFLILIGAATSEPLAEFFLTLGVVGISFTFGFSRLRVIPALLLIHALFGSFGYTEWVLGGVAGYLLIREILKLAKSKHSELILNIVEVPAVFLVLSPLLSYLQKWANSELFLILVGTLILFIGSSVTWVMIKKPDLNQIYLNLCTRMSRLLSPLHDLIDEKQFWISKKEIKSSVIQSDRIFVMITIVIFSWVLIWFISKGGLG